MGWRGEETGLVQSRQRIGNTMGYQAANTLSEELKNGYGMTIFCACGRCKQLRRADMEALIAVKGRNARAHTDWFKCSDCGRKSEQMHRRLLIYDPGEEKGPPA